MGTQEERADEQAAEWLAKLNTRSVTTEELESFYAWRRAPGNAERFARAEAFWRESRALGDDPDIAAAVGDALSRPRLERRGWRPSRRMVLAGAGLAPVAAGAGWLLVGMARAYRTAIGEQLLVSLADGSRIRLNTDSALRVHRANAGRRISLDRGEAFFDVKHDPARPFEVRARGVTVQAAGTQFDVRRAAGEVQVVLARGAVMVDGGAGAPARLARAGLSAIVNADGEIATRAVDLEAVTSWTSGRLVFRGTPLDQAIAEANRYSENRIELGDPTLEDAKVDGTFQTGDTESFVAAVSALFSLKQNRVENTIVLTRS
ncbi:FecR family protein [Sphingomonas sp. DT-207]|uniref:FecR family protein n=1 Tax=Sphingomonas sp. DT-207 TaxID=3396167 RepID=UPI003F1DE393